MCVHEKQDNRIRQTQRYLWSPENQGVLPKNGFPITHLSSYYLEAILLVTIYYYLYCNVVQENTKPQQFLELDIIILKCSKHIVLLFTSTKKNSLCDLLSWMLPFHENIIKTKPQQFLDVLINAINIYFSTFFCNLQKKEC